MAVTELLNSIRNRRIGEDGFMMVCNSENYVIVADSRSHYIGRSLEEYSEDMEKAKMNESIFFLLLDDVPHMLYLTEVYGYYIIGAYPVMSAFRTSLMSLLWILDIEAVLFLSFP
ncbi:MAG: hypothetical protein K6C41_05725 [Lachnospiraceae bacterium]|nr:hypothetical protein [Lachnospiraceae bacterium]